MLHPAHALTVVSALFEPLEEPRTSEEDDTTDHSVLNEEPALSKQDPSAPVPVAALLARGDSSESFNEEPTPISAASTTGGAGYVGDVDETHESDSDDHVIMDAVPEFPVGRVQGGPQQEHHLDGEVIQDAVPEFPDAAQHTAPNSIRNAWAETRGLFRSRKPNQNALTVDTTIRDM